MLIRTMEYRIGGIMRHSSELGIQLTISDIVQQLFPAGFFIKEYAERQARRDATEGIEADADSDLENHNRAAHRVFNAKFEKLLDTELDNERQLSEYLDQKIYDALVLLKENSDDSPKIAYIPDKYRAFPYTPFDMFAICATLLEKSGAYHHIEAEEYSIYGPNNMHRLVRPTQTDRRLWRDVGDKWRSNQVGELSYIGIRLPSDIEANSRGIPPYIIELWAQLLTHWDEPIFHPTSSTTPAPVWWSVAFALMAISDRAARDSGFITNGEDQNARQVGYMSKVEIGGYWAHFASTLLRSDARQIYAHDDSTVEPSIIPGGEDGRIHTLSAACRDHICVLPKSRTPQIGCTLRSLSHNLALLPARGSIRATWTNQDQGYHKISEVDREVFNLVIIPYPFKIEANEFKPVGRIADIHKWGTFAYFGKNDPSSIEEIIQLVNHCVDVASQRVDSIHGIVFPELALSALQFDAVYKYLLTNTNIELLCAGVNERYPIKERGELDSGRLFVPSNEAVLVSFNRLDDDRLTQTKPWYRDSAACSHRKHHRWRLDDSQIRRYDLSSSLDPAIVWWEDLRLSSRKLPMMVMRDQWVVSSLICEDLARVDPGQAVVRSIGPNLLISIVMDGPQIPGRWSAMYATVLAEDPGCSVLTLSSLALINRAQQSMPRPNFYDDDNQMQSIGLWRDDTGQVVPIELSQADVAACLTIYEHRHDEFTMDGRSNEANSTALRLGNYFTIEGKG